MKKLYLYAPYVFFVSDKRYEELNEEASRFLEEEMGHFVPEIINEEADIHKQFNIDIDDYIPYSDEGDKTVREILTDKGKTLVLDGKTYRLVPVD